jgi:hypothetical protein
MKNLNIYIVLFCIPMFLPACRTESHVAERKQCFDKNWKFCRGDITAASKPDFDDRSWRILDLPHDWSVEPITGKNSDSITGPFTKTSAGSMATGYTEGGTGWYRKTFVTGKTGKCYSIYFEGAYMESEIWVNGTKAAFHPYGYTSFSCDISRLLKPQGQSNLIAVKVTNSGKNSRWYAGSGIYRHVWRVVTPLVHLDPWNIYIQTTGIEQGAATLKIEASLFNNSDKTEAGSVEIRVLDPDGHQAAITDNPFRIQSDSIQSVLCEVQIPDPRLWSLDSTNLYSVVITLRSGKENTDQVSVPFGIRTLAFSAENGFMLNGKPIELKGGCMHHDNGFLGAASIDRAEERKVELLKANGFNAVRCAHNPPAEKFLEACDRLGLLVIDEAFDHWQLKKNDNDYHRYFDAWHEQDLASMVLRDRNHPSIIMWSIGNEIEERADTSGMEIARELRQIIYKYDQTRPVTAAVNSFWDRPQYTWKDSERAFHPLDVCGYNYALWEYENDHRVYPERIIFGSESTAQEASLNWDRVEKLPYVIGDFIWTAMDYLGEAGIGHTEYFKKDEKDTTFFVPWPWFNAWCGDIDLCGGKKPQGLYRDVLWGKSPVEILVHRPVLAGYTEKTSYWGWPDEIPSWNWEGFEGEPVNVRVFTRSPVVRLYLNGLQVDEQKIQMEGQWKYMAEFKVNYAPGELKAVGMTEGIEQCAARLKTTGPATAIKLVTDETVLSTDRNSLAYITIELRDKEGERVMNQDRKLKLSLTGAAEIAGSGNASPMDMASFRSFNPSTYQGRALVIIRPTGKPGKAILRVESFEEKENNSGNTLSEGVVTLTIAKKPKGK